MAKIRNPKILKVVIGGCRNYKNYNDFKSTLNDYFEKLEKNYQIIIISGHCSGVDTMAEQYAYEKGYTLEIFPADWKKYGKAAGPKRNEEMVKASNTVIAFWDNSSKGTKNLITTAEKHNKNIIVFNI